MVEGQRYLSENQFKTPVMPSGLAGYLSAANLLLVTSLLLFHNPQMECGF